MNTLRRRAVGISLIIAAAAVVAVGYGTAPSAAACATANNLAHELGNPATCSTTPPAAYFIGAVTLLIAGLLVLVPWWRDLPGQLIPRIGRKTGRFVPFVHANAV